MRIAVSRAPGAGRVVTPLELFFDLVYVFAIGELSQHLVELLDLRTGAETAVLALAVLYAWYMIVWGSNWLDPNRSPVRLLLLGLTFASLLMSTAITDAFDGRAWLFVAGYLFIQLGRSIFLIVVLRGRPQGEHFVNDLVWELLAGALWVAGALTGHNARLVLWGLAVALSYVGVSLLHWLPGRGRRMALRHAELAGEHLIERFRLFFIIALGETVLTMGTAFAGGRVTFERLLALAISLTGTVALWWNYFERAEGIAVEATERPENAGPISWWGTVTLTLIVVALIAVAVGDELAIAHPGDDATLGFTVLTFGGPALFLPRPGRLPARGARSHSTLATRGGRGAGDPRRRHGAAASDRRDRRIHGRARRSGDPAHGRQIESGTEHRVVAWRDRRSDVAGHLLMPLIGRGFQCRDVHRPNAHITIDGNSCRQNAPPCDPARSVMTTSAPASRSATAHRAAFSWKNGSSVPATKYARGSRAGITTGGW
jgi:low temperature requirement protein LtrA